MLLNIADFFFWEHLGCWSTGVRCCRLLSLLHLVLWKVTFASFQRLWLLMRSFKYFLRWFISLKLDHIFQAVFVVKFLVCLNWTFQRSFIESDVFAFWSITRLSCSCTIKFLRASFENWLWLLRFRSFWKLILSLQYRFWK